MPQRTGTRTGGQIAWTAIGALACRRIITKFPGARAGMAQENAALRPQKRKPLTLNYGRAFSSYDPIAIAPRAKQTAMPMTIVNRVIHMARLLFRQRECSRGEVRPWQRAKVVPVPGLFHSRANWSEDRKS